METYLTVDELADYLKLKEQTIRRWVLNREIPYRKIRKVIRFRLSEIEKWINADGRQLMPEENEGQECGLFDDVIASDELAETEPAQGQAENGDNE